MDSTPENGVREGQARRDSALGLLETHRRDTIRKARREFLQLLLSRPEGTGSVDEIRDRVPLATGIDPTCFGAVPGALRNAGIIAAGGFVTSGRAVAHARPIRVWKLSSRSAALAWLRDNPAPVEPERPRDGRQNLLFGLEA